MKTMYATLLALCALGATSMTVQAQDAAQGQKKAAMCMGCHSIIGYQASFPEVHKVPMISGQNAKYIVAALNAYKKGERKHPSMHAIAVSLSDQDIAELAEFFATHGIDAQKAPDKAATQQSAQVAELLKKGNCASCHGENLSKPIDASYPKLAGQHADYLYVALKAYQTDKNPQVGRANPIMMGISRPFTHAELKALSQYIASLPGELKTIPESRFR